MGKTPIKVLSLFDGISCARQALHDLGIPVSLYYASEVDKYALQISAQRWPEIIQLGDVHIINTPMLLVRNIDLMIGGSPCQDLSIAGKRKGLDGERSGLFWEYVRVLKEVQPKYFVLENVASMNIASRDIISKELGVEPIMIDAALVSGQRRKRLFWTNIPGIRQPEDKGILLRDILQPVVDDKYIYRGKVNNASQGTRVYDIEGKSATLSALGGGAGAKTGLYTIPRGFNKGGIRASDKAPTLTTSRFDQNNMVVIPIDKDGNEKLESNTLRTSGIGSGVDDKHNWDAVRVTDDGQRYIIRRLTPTECERLQSLPDGYTAYGKLADGQYTWISDTQRYKALGNGFNADVISHILSFMPNDREVL